MALVVVGRCLIAGGYSVCGTHCIDRRGAVSPRELSMRISYFQYSVRAVIVEMSLCGRLDVAWFFASVAAV